MSVSSASLSPRSKSTVRKAATCGHILFLGNVRFRATSCSMMAEEPLPPKPASITSFRCKDGRSARPHHGCRFDPKTWTTKKKEIWNRDAPRIYWKMSSNDENSGILVFQGQHRGMHVPTHPKTPKRNRHSLRIAIRSWHTTSCKPATSNKHGKEYHQSKLHWKSMRKQWKIHRSWHIAAVMWSSLLLGHFFEPKTRNNNHQFPIRLDLIHPECSWIQDFIYRYDSDIIKEKNKNQQGQHWQQKIATPTLVTNCVTYSFCKV